MATGRGRKKNKIKLVERSHPSLRDKFSDDPAFTEDVRHLALPLRRNSGPEAEINRMFSRKSKVAKNNTYDGNTNHYSLRIERKKKISLQSNNYSAEYLCQNTSSSESLDNLISSYKIKSRKGFSLDRNPQPSTDAEPKSKPKRSSWFLREKNRDKSKSEKFNKRGSLDFTLSSYETTPKEEKAVKKSNKHHIQRQNAADYSTNPTDSSTTTPQEEFLDLKKHSLSKFQIGKRFLKGEIGIKSFNYYLLKEGLKKNLLKQQQSSSETTNTTTKSTYISKSEENIYEEIFFHDQNVAVSQPVVEEKKEPPPLPPFTKQMTLKQKNSNDGNCMNCEICIQEAQKQLKCKAQNCEMCAINHQQNSCSQSSNQNHYAGGNNNNTNGSGYGKITKKLDDTIYDFFQQQHGQNVLQFQSYNPNNPNIYKIETTPVAFGDYNPLEDQIYQQEQLQKQHYQVVKKLSADGQVPPHKSSSSSDSAKHHHHHHHHHHHPPSNYQSNEFYKRPNYYSSNDERQMKKHEPIYKTDSSASILSESNSIRSDNSLNRYNNQQNNHNRYATSTHQFPHESNMSDSSLGDSLFSYTGDASKRYFGSSESCRFGYECRRCSLETEKCSFSDTCNLRNCDCSSSYFSSDFDDTNIYNSQNQNQSQSQSRKKEQIYNEQFYEQKANRYAEDFIKHVNNVKKRSQNLIYESGPGQQIITTSSIYEVPKSNKTLSTFDTETGTDNSIMPMAINETEIRSKDVIYVKGRRSTGTTPKISSVSSNESKARSSMKVKNNQANQISIDEKKLLVNKDKDKDIDIEIDIPSSPKNNQNPNENQKEKENKVKKNMKNKKEQEVEDDDDEVFIDTTKLKLNVTETSNLDHQAPKSPKQTKNQQISVHEKEKVDGSQPQINSQSPSKNKNSSQQSLSLLQQSLSPKKALSPSKKALKALSLKAPAIENIGEKESKESKEKQKQSTKMDEKTLKKNNNKDDESDDDDDVFIDDVFIDAAKLKNNENKKENIEQQSTNNENVVNTNTTTPSKTMDNSSTITLQKTVSRDLNIDDNRDQNTKKPQATEANCNDVPADSKSESTERVIQANDQSDIIIDFPLPEIPIKKKQLNKERALSKDSLLTQKDTPTKMHYRNTSNENKPTYLFGENVQSNKKNDDIFLNRSGWIQMGQSQRFDKHSESRRESMNKLIAANSKIEELISRNEARRVGTQVISGKDDNVTILKIDSQHPHQLGGDRPGFLPVKTNLSRDPPPPTPILSPPPAFQDHKNRNAARVLLSVTDSDNNTSSPNIGKGMVFSRSFEYDNRKSSDLNTEAFSRSFDFDVEMAKNLAHRNFLARYGKSTTFSTLTGISPNYLTKKENRRDTSPAKTAAPQNNSSIFPKVIPGKNVNTAPFYRSNVGGEDMKRFGGKNKSLDENRSRRSQFMRPVRSGFRSFETSINQRLNSCDSGARSDISNDDLEDEMNEDDDDQSSSLALSYKSQGTSYLENMSRNISKTFLNQNQSQYKNRRSLTPETSFDDYDLLNVQKSSSKKPRSLTPDKRSNTPDEKLSKSLKTTSQTSLMSRQSSGSRNSTLERQSRDGRSRSSSSSSSYSENDKSLRRNQLRPPFKSAFGDYRIRRSRSLQLSERSPNRSYPQKVVVRIGNTPTVQTANNNMTQRSEKPDYAQPRILTLTTKFNQPSFRSSEISLTGNKQTKSFDLLDFDKRPSNYDYEVESKSKSFDDDFCFNTKFSRNERMNRNMMPLDGRAFSQDRVLLGVPQNTSKSLRNSPRNYGNRMYDQENPYEVGRRAMTRSPIMGYNNQQQPMSRERSPIGRQSRDKRDYYKKTTSSNSFLMPKSTTPNRSPSRTPNRSSDSDDSIENVSSVLKEKSLVAEYLFGLKTKQLKKQQQQQQKQQQLQLRSNTLGGTTPSSGSCSASSCDFWPHCIMPNQIKYHSDDQITITNHINDKLSSESKNYVSVTSPSSSNSNSNLFKFKDGTSTSTGTSVAINNRPTNNNQTKLNNNSIIFLGDCEMPITKQDRFKNNNNNNNKSGSDYSENNGSDCGKNLLSNQDNKTQNLPVGNNGKSTSNKSPSGCSTSGGDGDTKSNLLANSLRLQNYGKGKYFQPLFSSKEAAAMKRRHFSRLKSRSLPKSLSFMCYSNLSSEGPDLTSMFPPHSPLQIRAVSSPSLTENPAENKPTEYVKSSKNQNGSNHNELLTDRQQNTQASSGSVLQKFKKTFSHFKGKSNVPATVDNIESAEPKQHRFGPLVWRTSKERRKTKTHRRDKCNSGDSGIQVELENDEAIPTESMEISPTIVKVRRANSAKSSTTAIVVKDRALLTKKNSDSSTTQRTRISRRSLSHPADLDVLIQETNLMDNLKNIRHIDDEGEDGDSDTDSLTSNHGEDADEEENESEGRSPMYAEVLYHFQAGGPQELSLEKGSLVEILRRESGPWWWGQVKYDALISNSGAVEIHQGWFPKDFVKIIPNFTKKTTTVHKENHTNEISNCDISNNHHHALPPVSAAPLHTISSSQSSSELIKDNIIKELLETEINYVKLLSSLCVGFIKEMREHPDVFPAESINIIFSNIEKIYRFQQTFLEALRLAIPNSRLGEVFLEYQSAFMIYSQYCNSYPRALMELETYTGNKEAGSILENCRQSQNLPELPLSAHLLAPIQRICRYPLHLSELVKHSKSRREILMKTESHQLTKQEAETIDCKEIYEMALNAMKRVTEMVNEGKRHSEYLSRIQARFENFQGPSINIHSTRLFLQTDAIRISPTLWNNTYTLFLFDRQLIYCKKDLLKRNNYIYKGRIFLDNCRILNLPDGKMFGVNLKNALRIYCEQRNKWFDFCFRSNSSKIRFLNTLSAERQFCGESLFVSEIASGSMDDDYSDENNVPVVANNDYDERAIDVDRNMPMTYANGVPSNEKVAESPVKQPKISETAPKKPRKFSKEIPQQQSQIIIDYNPSSSNSNSLNRRRLGNWFRKSKSTNSTPSQSPTHYPLISAATVPSVVPNSDSNSSSQSSPVNYARNKFKEPAGGGGISNGSS